MSLNSMEQFSTSQLEAELQNRKALILDQEQALKAEKELNAYLNRPPCDVLGRAYGFGNQVYNANLAGLSIVGNSGRTFGFSANVVKPVYLYLNNVFGWDKEIEFENAIKILTKSYLASRLNDPKVILDLIGLSVTHYHNLNEVVRNSLDKAIIERMAEFSDKQLLHLNRHASLHHGDFALEVVLKSRGLLGSKKNALKKTK